MKKLLLALFAISCGAALFAAPAPRGSTTPEGWYDDFAAAQKEAVKTGRPMLVLLTGSDWCGFCVRLKKTVLDTDGFKQFAAEKLILVYLDFPSHRVKLPAELTKQNAALEERFRVGGYPTTVILSPDGKELGRIVGAARNYLERVKKLVR